MMWQLIEKAPKDGTQVLLWCNASRTGVEVGSFRNDYSDWNRNDPQWFDNSFDDYSCGYASKLLKPTHWMPLPEAPEA